MPYKLPEREQHSARIYGNHSDPETTKQDVGTAASPRGTKYLSSKVSETHSIVMFAFLNRLIFLEPAHLHNPTKTNETKDLSIDMTYLNIKKGASWCVFLFLEL
jgi:hypothetical protein